MASARHGACEIAVSGWAGRLGPLEQLLPEPVFDGIKRLVGGRRLLDPARPELP